MADKQEKEKNLHAGHRQRMKQRFIDYGFQGMQQHEILEILLYYAIPRKDTNPLAHRLLDRYGSFAKVCDSPVDELQRNFGMSESAAVLLKMIPELARTYSETKTLVDHINMKNAPEILRKKFIGAIWRCATTQNMCIWHTITRVRCAFPRGRTSRPRT